MPPAQRQGEQPQGHGRGQVQDQPQHPGQRQLGQGPAWQGRDATVRARPPQAPASPALPGVGGLGWWQRWLREPPRDSLPPTHPLLPSTHLLPLPTQTSQSATPHPATPPSPSTICLSIHYPSLMHLPPSIQAPNNSTTHPTPHPLLTHLLLILPIIHPLYSTCPPTHPSRPPSHLTITHHPAHQRFTPSHPPTDSISQQPASSPAASPPSTQLFIHPFHPRIQPLIRSSTRPPIW